MGRWLWVVMMLSIAVPVRAECVRRTPYVLWGHYPRLTVAAPGEVFRLEVLFQNADSVECPPEWFDLTLGAHGGWDSVCTLDHPTPNNSLVAGEWEDGDGNPGLSQKLFEPGEVFVQYFKTKIAETTPRPCTAVPVAFIKRSRFLLPDFNPGCPGQAEGSTTHWEAEDAIIYVEGD